MKVKILKGVYQGEIKGENIKTWGPVEVPAASHLASPREDSVPLRLPQNSLVMLGLYASDPLPPFISRLALLSHATMALWILWWP